MLPDHSAVTVNTHGGLCIFTGDTLDILEKLRAKLLYIIKNLHGADSTIIINWSFWVTMHQFTRIQEKFLTFQ